MPNVQAVCTSFKVQMFNGIHAFGTSIIRATTTPDAFKAALYLVTGSLGAATTVYSSTAEVTGTNYVAGGIAVTNAVPPASSAATAYWTPSASLVWNNVTLSNPFDTVLIYNLTQSSAAVACYNFGSQTITAGNLTLTMPTNSASTALLNLT